MGQERNISEATEACSLHSKGNDNSGTRTHKSTVTNQNTELRSLSIGSRSHSVYSKELEAGVAQLI